MKSESVELTEEEGIDTNGFEINHPEGEAFVETNGIAFSDALKRVVFAAGGKDNWRRLDVVNLAQGESFIELTATDGCRLAIAKVPVSGNLAAGIIIPAESAKKIGAILSSAKKQVRLGIANKFLHLESDDVAVAVGRVYTDFPDCKSVISQDYKTTFTVDADKLLKALKGFSLTRESAVTFEVSQNGGSIHPYGDNDKTLQIEGECSGEPISVSLNSRYLIEPLKVLSKERARIAVKDKNSAVLITTGDNYRYFAMPIVEEEEEDKVKVEAQKEEEVSNETEQKEEQAVVGEGTEK